MVTANAVESWDTPHPNADHDRDRHELWEMLVHRDIEALVLGDWTIVQSDFVTGGFIVMDAHGTIDTSQWTVAFADLGAYARTWRRKSEELRLALGRDRLRALLYERNRLARIEIVDDVAMVEKTIGGLFWAVDLGLESAHTTTVCQCQRIDGRWRVGAILSRLPREAAGGPAVMPADPASGAVGLSRSDRSATPAPGRHHVAAIR